MKILAMNVIFSWALVWPHSKI